MDRHAVGRIGRKWWCGMYAAAVLTGCASPMSDNAADSSLLKPGQALTGARLQPRPTLAFGDLSKAGIGGYLPFMSPTQVAVRNNLIYVADAGHRQIFRYDPTQLAMHRFADYAATAVAGIAVAPDMSLYVVDTTAQQVLHFSQDGRLLRGFSSQALARPVAMTLDESTGQLLVADSLYNHIVAFSSLGRPLGTLKSLEARGIDAMASGPDGVYLVDRLSKQVVVMGLDGVDRYTFGDGILKDPLAIAVDRYNRVFVSDGFDNTIKVFEGGELLVTLGGTGNSPVRFNRITSLALDHGWLYIADSLNTRIQIFHVAPPAEPHAAKAP